MLSYNLYPRSVVHLIRNLNPVGGETALSESGSVSSTAGVRGGGGAGSSSIATASRSATSPDPPARGISSTSSCILFGGDCSSSFEKEKTLLSLPSFCNASFLRYVFEVSTLGAWVFGISVHVFIDPGRGVV